MFFQHGAIGLGINIARRFGRGVDEQSPLLAGRGLRHFEFARPVRGMKHEHHSSGGRIGKPVVPKMLVRLGPLAFQSIGLPSGPYQLTSGS